MNMVGAEFLPARLIGDDNHWASIRSIMESRSAVALLCPHCLQQNPCFRGVVCGRQDRRDGSAVRAVAERSREKLSLTLEEWELSKVQPVLASAL